MEIARVDVMLTTAGEILFTPGISANLRDKRDLSAGLLSSKGKVIGSAT